MAHRIMFLDLEVENHVYHGQLASPRDPRNYVVMVGQAVDTAPYDGAIQGAHYHNREQSLGWLKIPEDVWLLVAHNAPFEMMWMAYDCMEELMRFLKRGGRVFDTAYGHYLLSNQQHTYPALDEIAPLYGGTHKIDAVKLLWQQGKLTSEIDPDLLAEYLLGPEGDIENTRKVFYGVAQKLQERGMWDMALDRMEGQLFTSLCMHFGLKVDRKLAFEERDRIHAEVERLREKFRETRTYLPAECEFKETSKHHMSAWVYGGPIKYRARVPSYNDDGTPKYENTDCYKFGEAFVPVEAIGDNADAFEACVRGYGEPDRYKAGKNKGQPKVHKIKDESRPKMVWGEKLVQCPGLVDLSAIDKAFKTEFVREHSGKLALADDSPVISTGADAIETISKRPELSEDTRQVMQELLAFFRMHKDLSTYYLTEEVDDEGNVVKQSGMLQYLTPEDFVHHSLNTTSTSTGRLSSNNPNFQNLPRGDQNELHTSRVKSMFVSRFGDDGYIVGPDYTALEVVTLATFSGDPALCRALVEGTDMHCLRLAAKTGEPYDVVYEKCHNKEHPEHRQYKQMRTDIKPPSFAYQYGATAMGIAFATGMAVEDAEAFIAREKALFPGVEAWYEDSVYPEVQLSIEQHREQGEDGTWRMYGVGTWKSPAGTTYQFRQYPKVGYHNGQRINYMEFKPTQMRNYPIQGESSFFVQVICGQVIRWLISNDFMGGRVLPINTVHDALYFDVHKDAMVEFCQVIKPLMESIPQVLSKYPYTFPVPFPVEVEYGKNMQEMKPFNLEDFQRE